MCVLPTCQAMPDGMFDLGSDIVRHPLTGSTTPNVIDGLDPLSTRLMPGMARTGCLYRQKLTTYFT